MRVVTKITDYVYRDVVSEEFFTTIAGVSKILDVDQKSAELILSCYPDNILRVGVSAAEIELNEEVIANDFLAKLLLGNPEVLEDSAKRLESVLGITNTMKTNSRRILPCIISSHFAAKLILDSCTANKVSKTLAQSLLLTTSASWTEEIWRKIVGNIFFASQNTAFVDM
jgi:hypothetical protein